MTVNYKVNVVSISVSKSIGLLMVCVANRLHIYNSNLNARFKNLAAKMLMAF